MSRHEVDVVNCDHEYVEPRTDEATGDNITVCCHCDETLQAWFGEDALPKHWFDHIPQLHNKPEPVKLSEDILRGDFFEGQDDRLVHVCGACGHWLTAVHGTFFENFESEEDITESDSGFVSNLRETLCPECGAACFRDGSVVIPLEAARGIRSNYDITRYVLNRADSRVWHNGVESMGRGIAMSRKLESSLHHHGWWSRCPACGYAEQYGSREFDFHHWDYDDDVGCCLCRKCHTDIHDGMTATEQSETTGREWQYDAVARLYDLSVQNGLEFRNNQRFMWRYNIPSAGVTGAAVNEVFASE
jgi:hypothetical protein